MAPAVFGRCRSGKPGGDGDSGGFGAVANSELDEDVAQVPIRRAFADEEPLGQFTIGEGLLGIEPTGPRW